MSYNQNVIDGMLPDPGLPEQEACSFPPGKNRLRTTVAMGEMSIAGAYRKSTDDLTFIIPYATAPTRYESLCAVVAWIISTTSAKIILMSAENEESFNEWINPKLAFFNSQSSGLPLRWSQYCDRDPQHAVNMLKSQLLVDICTSFFGGYTLKSQFGLTLWEDERLLREFSNRVELMIQPRAPGEPFHRTKYLNKMLDQVQTQIVCNHDADTLLTSHAVMTSVSYINMGYADAVYPYSRSLRSQQRVFFQEASPPGPLNALIVTGDMSPLLNEGMQVMPSPAAYGQSIFFKTSSYKSIGGENEEFVGWGPEDLERYSRAVKLGLAVCRVDSPIVHLEHPPGAGNSERLESNKKLYDELSKKSPDELRKYYDSVEYKKDYGW